MESTRRHRALAKIHAVKARKRFQLQSEIAQSTKESEGPEPVQIEEPEDKVEEVQEEVQEDDVPEKSEENEVPLINTVVADLHLPVEKNENTELEEFADVPLQDDKSEPSRISCDAIQQLEAPQSPGRSKVISNLSTAATPRSKNAADHNDKVVDMKTMSQKKVPRRFDLSHEEEGKGKAISIPKHTMDTASTMMKMDDHSTVDSRQSTRSERTTDKMEYAMKYVRDEHSIGEETYSVRSYMEERGDFMKDVEDFVLERLNCGKTNPCHDLGSRTFSMDDSTVSGTEKTSKKSRYDMKRNFSVTQRRPRMMSEDFSASLPEDETTLGASTIGSSHIMEGSFLTNNLRSEGENETARSYESKKEKPMCESINQIIRESAQSLRQFSKMRTKSKTDGSSEASEENRRNIQVPRTSTSCNESHSEKTSGATEMYAPAEEMESIASFFSTNKAQTKKETLNDLVSSLRKAFDKDTTSSKLEKIRESLKDTDFFNFDHPLSAERFYETFSCACGVNERNQDDGQDHFVAEEKPTKLSDKVKAMLYCSPKAGDIGDEKPFDEPATPTEIIQEKHTEVLTFKKVRTPEPTMPKDTTLLQQKEEIVSMDQPQTPTTPKTEKDTENTYDDPALDHLESSTPSPVHTPVRVAYDGDHPVKSVSLGTPETTNSVEDELEHRSADDAKEELGTQGVRCPVDNLHLMENVKVTRIADVPKKTKKWRKLKGIVRPLLRSKKNATKVTSDDTEVFLKRKNMSTLETFTKEDDVNSSTEMLLDPMSNSNPRSSTRNRLDGSIRQEPKRSSWKNTQTDDFDEIISKCARAQNWDGNLPEMAIASS